MSFLNIFKGTKRDNAKLENPALDEIEPLVNALPNARLLDTNDENTILKFKERLQRLIIEAKEKNSVDKFILIRDDNFFPYDYEWIVSSKETCLEKNAIALSHVAREEYAIEKSGLNNEISGIKVPIDKDKIDNAIKSLGTKGLLNIPVGYRSTKHFTINTPLEVTGNYNSVEAHRNYTILDLIDNFLDSSYGYSISYHDAYLDVSHKPLKISDNAIILIEEHKYKELSTNELLMRELSKRQVVIYRGREYLAIDILLTELGALPSKVGSGYAEYDQEMYDILDESLRSLATNNNLLYDKSHFASTDGHFTSIMDSKNNDRNESINEFVDFLREKFPNERELFTPLSVTDISKSYDILKRVNAKSVIDAIEEYNFIKEQRLAKTLKEYKEDRNRISDDINKIFILTFKSIKKYYESNIPLEDSQKERLESLIDKFFHSMRVDLELEASKEILSILSSILDFQIEDVNSKIK